jgi:hypothetical protein
MPSDVATLLCPSETYLLASSGFFASDQEKVATQLMCMGRLAVALSQKINIEIQSCSDEKLKLMRYYLRNPVFNSI